MAQETLKLKELYEKADDLKQKMDRVVQQYIARLILVAEREAVDASDIEALQALAQMMVAIMSKRTAENFINDNSGIKDIGVQIPVDALEFSTLLRSIPYLAGVEFVPAEVAAPAEADPKYREWPALGKFLHDNSMPGNDGKRYIQSAKVTPIIGGDRELPAKYSCLNYYLHDCIKYKPQEIGAQGAPNTRWYEIQDCFSKLLMLKNSTKIELTIER